MKRLVFSILFCFGLAALSGQSFNLILDMGGGTYTMTDLRNYNKSLVAKLPFGAGIVSNFPEYYFYEPSLVFNWKRFGFGFTWSFNSTGSRVSATDSTGKYNFDTKINYMAPGIVGSYDIYATSLIRVSLYSSVKTGHSKLRTHEYLLADKQVLTDKNSSFKSVSTIIEPGLRFSISKSIFSLGCNLGYAISARNHNFKSDGDEFVPFFYPVSLKGFKPVWQGVRFGALLQIRIFRFARTEDAAKGNEVRF